MLPSPPRPDEERSGEGRGEGCEQEEEEGGVRGERHERVKRVEWSRTSVALCVACSASVVVVASVPR